MNMIIRNAFEKNENIRIDFYCKETCPCCEKKFITEEDEELSFYGNIDDFKKHQEEYHDPFDFDLADEITECIDENGEVFYKYIKDRTIFATDNLCPKCEKNRL